MSMCRKHGAECHGVKERGKSDSDPDIPARVCGDTVSRDKEHLQIGGVTEIDDS